MLFVAAKLSLVLEVVVLFDICESDGELFYF